MGGGVLDAKDKFKIKMDNHDGGFSQIWDYQEFLKKLEKMKEMTNYYYETGTYLELEPSEDPFYGKPKPSLIGQAYYALKPLAFLIDNPCSVPVIVQKGRS